MQDGNQEVFHAHLTPQCCAALGCDFTGSVSCSSRQECGEQEGDLILIRVWMNSPLLHSCADSGPRLRGGTAFSPSRGWHFGYSTDVTCATVVSRARACFKTPQKYPGSFPVFLPNTKGCVLRARACSNSKSKTHRQALSLVP